MTPAMAESTRSMRRVIFDRDIVPVWKNRLLTEITPDDLRALCLKVKERGAPATAIHVRDIVKQIYGFAILHGERITNPADDVGPASIATFAPRDRALSPTEIRIMLRQLELVPTLPTLRLGLRLILLTMVRKSELLGAVWDEVDFENAVWTRQHTTVAVQGIAQIVYPAQHESFATSLAKPSAANFRPSTVVRYGKIVSARSSTVSLCLIASAAV
jgi:integrase